ncbi:MAG TPA: hypothetical protein PKA64_09320, partial [Myxococcota bacterium]|nr:hypothetical protein [Myxococcota bacterium]
RPAARDAVPPRPVALAMAQALFAVPHLGRTLGSAPLATSFPGFRANQALSDVLGIPPWELEPLREAVDLRVSAMLRQRRSLMWLWQRSGDPAQQPRALYDTLFPTTGGPPPQRFERRGGRLYAVFADTAPLPADALYLRWIAPHRPDALWPDDTFQARYVDDTLVRALGRGLGVTPDEAPELLDNLVCVVPAADDSRFVRLDRWRSEGWADISGLARAADTPAWITLPLTADAMDDDLPIERVAEGVVTRNPRRVFDRQATTRITAVVQGLYAALCARLVAGEPLDGPALARLFDLGPHIQRALQPLLDWPALTATHAHLAHQLGVSTEEVAGTLALVRDVWLKAAHASWGGRSSPERPVTVQTVLATHMAATAWSLVKRWREQGDARVPHQPVLALFFATYAQQAALSRLWRAPDGTLPPPEDVVGQWFPVLWRRILDTVGLDEPVN